MAMISIGHKKFQQMELNAEDTQFCNKSKQIQCISIELKSQKSTKSKSHFDQIQNKSRVFSLGAAFRGMVGGAWGADATLKQVNKFCVEQIRQSAD